MFATGVTIVTARSAQGDLVGLTVSSFNTVSLAPPLVLWSLAHSAASSPVFAAGPPLASQVLRAQQQALAERFATRGVDRWAGVQYTSAANGTPLLAGAPPMLRAVSAALMMRGMPPEQILTNF